MLFWLIPLAVLVFSGSLATFSKDAEIIGGGAVVASVLFALISFVGSAVVHTDTISDKPVVKVDSVGSGTATKYYLTTSDGKGVILNTKDTYDRIKLSSNDHVAQTCSITYSVVVPWHHGFGGCDYTYYTPSVKRILTDDNQD